MKQRTKKLVGIFLAVTCAVALTACGSSKEDSGSQANEQIQSSVQITAEQLTETIVPLTDEEIETYSNSGDEFTEQAMEAWQTSKEELGQLKETKDTVVEYEGTEYTVTVPANFENAEANFIYVFDKTGTPTSLSVDVQYPMSVTLERAALNTVMGLGTVFIMLIFLSFVISLLKPLTDVIGGKKKQVQKEETAPAPVVTAAPEQEEELADDTELVAVIAAAIAAAEGTSPDGFVVRSIKKVKRKKW